MRSRNYDENREKCRQQNEIGKRNEEEEEEEGKQQSSEWQMLWIF